MKLRYTDIAIIFVALTLFVLIHRNLIKTDRFIYDEPDYIYAVSKGFIANYLDKPTLPLQDFIKIGINEGINKNNRSQLSEFIRNSDDVGFYRHYHGPFYFYWLSVLDNITGNSEYSMRWATLVTVMLSMIISYIGIILILGQNGRLAASLVLIFFIFSGTLVEEASIISPHGMYALISLIALLLLTKFIQTFKLKYWYFAAFALIIACITIEYALFLFITFVIVLFINRKKLFNDWTKRRIVTFFIKTVGLWFVTVMVIWPAGILKLSIIKYYMFAAYVLFFRSQAFGSLTFFEFWTRQIQHSPFEYILVILLVIISVIILFRKNKNQLPIPLVLYTILIFSTTLLNRASDYIVILLPIAFVVAGCTLTEILRTKKLSIYIISPTLLVLILFINNHFIFKENEVMNIQRKYFNKIVKFIETNNLSNSYILTHQRFIPTIHYYFPNTKLRLFLPETDFDSLDQMLEKGNFDGFLYFGPDQEKVIAKLDKSFVSSHEVISALEEEKLVYYFLIQFKTESPEGDSVN